MCAHVVVAEDDAKQAELVRRYLEHDRHDVTVVRDGGAALDEIRRRLPDLLILDVMMPGLDGLGVCRAVRSEAALEGLPVLMLTARTTEDDLLLGLDLGADDYLTTVQPARADGPHPGTAAARHAHPGRVRRRAVRCAG